MVVAGAGKDGSVWKMITGSNNEAFGEAAKGLYFSGGPPIGVGGLTCSVTVPFLSKEMLPFNVKTGGKLPSV